MITSKLGFELVGIYRALFFLVQDLQFALRRAGQNPTDVEVALCQVLEKGKNMKQENFESDQSSPSYLDSRFMT